MTSTVSAFHGTAVDADARRDLLAVLFGLAALCIWDASGFDIVLTRWYGTASGFPWMDHWFVSGVLHKAIRVPAWLLFGLLAVGIWKPVGPMRVVPRRERIWWLATTVGCVLLIPLLKRESATSCPWELAEFGGRVAQYVPHWHLFARDDGPGQCFPSGHASTALAFFPGWFALRGKARGAARVWLAVVLVSGAVFAWVQVMRGAHYLSHSLWTAWICWAVTAASFHACHAWWRAAQSRRGLLSAAG
jgi:membrane-associated PAP2 superfamily phosphatase